MSTMMQALKWWSELTKDEKVFYIPKVKTNYIPTNKEIEKAYLELR